MGWEDRIIWIVSSNICNVFEYFAYSFEVISVEISLREWFNWSTERCS